jgi:hypothetical protein
VGFPFRGCKFQFSQKDNFMAENKTFTPLLEAEVSNLRRVSSSFTNWFSSIGRDSFTAENAFDTTMNVAGNASGTLGLVAGAATIAGSAVAGGAFLAACAGPQVAVTAGVLGIVVLAKQTYSNRESAHRALAPLVWNLVDTQAPSACGGGNVQSVVYTADQLNTGASAALELLTDGQNQLKLLGEKLKAADIKFQEFNTLILNDQKRADQLTNRFNASRLPAERKALRVEYSQIKSKTIEQWKTNAESGGAIFEYVRRLSHTGNYLQAPYLLALAMQERAFPNSVVGKPQKDYFLGSPLAASRDVLKNIDSFYELMRVGHYAPAP